ncbi:hypothetical protein S225a_08580 [Candidatus Brocadiaceae bacterium S225]|nr:hypothetical protein S225a_08580 [Candidatus Brocadiaceae bacterium S225]
MLEVAGVDGLAVLREMVTLAGRSLRSFYWCGSLLELSRKGFYGSKQYCSTLFSKFQLSAMVQHLYLLDVIGTAKKSKKASQTKFFRFQW